jgi:hypothetical protein
MVIEFFIIAWSVFLSGDRGPENLLDGRKGGGILWAVGVRDINLKG